MRDIPMALVEAAGGGGHHRRLIFLVLVVVVAWLGRKAMRRRAEDRSVKSATRQSDRHPRPSDPDRSRDASDDDGPARMDSADLGREQPPADPPSRP